jgi:homoaconitase/3-isopropylmalate dehydratase large subunit
MTARSITQKIIDAHYIESEKIAGQEVAVSIDQTLTQDATGTMAYLQFEAIGVPRVQTKLSVSYIDHTHSNLILKIPTIIDFYNLFHKNMGFIFQGPEME